MGHSEEESMRSKIRALLFTFIIVCMTLILFGSVIVLAQDGGDDGDGDEGNAPIPISYGQTLEGEITNNEYEIFYSFTGSAGDVVVIEMRPIEIIESELIAVEQFDSPRLEVHAPNDDIIAQTTRYDRADVILQLPEDGDYIIKATREDGEIGISIGEYTIKLLKPIVLEFDEVIEGTIRSNERNYYVVRDTDQFTIEYERIDGDFSPEVGVIVMVENELFNDLNAYGYVAALSGLQLESGTLRIRGDNRVFVIIVHQALFDFNFQEDPVLSDYVLRITE
jgi:hypothetical protein